MVLHVGTVGKPVGDMGDPHNAVKERQCFPRGQGRKPAGDQWSVSMDPASHVHGVADDHTGVGVRVFFILARVLLVTLERGSGGETLL